MGDSLICSELLSKLSVSFSLLQHGIFIEATSNNFKELHSLQSPNKISNCFCFQNFGLGTPSGVNKDAAE